ncbi:GvpL/GvpF family gas vesicle protein [Streptomyces sp. NPDC090499]|uniref:GvpL/GvpF family gas vesicle protein n=1 Tax=Streptomyces sp. NPDC090499 TaxID=3365965 RepID=UPI003809D8C9
MTAQGGLRYVYAVCRPFAAALQTQLSGVAGVPPGLLRHHGLVAVVSTVPEGDFAEEPLRDHLEDLDWLAATARAHQGVIDALTTVTTPLPLRLATVFRDDSGVRTMMEAREADFLHTLDRLEGRVEWGVKLYADPPEQPPPPAGRPATGREYLRQRRTDTRAHEEKRRAAEEFARTLHERLSGRAEACRLHPPQNATLSGVPGQNLLNAAYLVSRADSEEFVELVDRTKDETPAMRVELTGPWAAYSFTEPTAEPTTEPTTEPVTGPPAPVRAGEQR